VPKYLFCHDQIIVDFDRCDRTTIIGHNIAWKQPAHRQVWFDFQSVKS